MLAHISLKFEEENFIVMSVEEMKKTIKENVETLSEDQLIQVKEFVESINNVTSKEYNLLPHVENIVSEREEVLKKLAQ